jgi:hypothetical protein
VLPFGYASLRSSVNKENKRRPFAIRFRRTGGPSKLPTGDELIRELAGCIKHLPATYLGSKFVGWIKDCQDDYTRMRNYTARQINEQEGALRMAGLPRTRPTPPPPSSAPRTSSSNQVAAATTHAPSHPEQLAGPGASAPAYQRREGHARDRRGLERDAVCQPP